MINDELKPHSKNISQDTLDILLPYNQRINVRSEADFYGASHLIAEHLGLTTVPNSYSSWSHGPSIKGLKYVDHIIWNKGWLKNRLVVNRQVEQFLLENHVQKVKAVGLPITYVKSQNIKRRGKSVLFMLAHSLPNTKINHDLSGVIEHCNNLKLRGIYVCFCIHSDCHKENIVPKELDENGVDWFVGSAVNDINSLKRMRNIFEYFETVASNTMGSHFFYAQLFGAKFFFTEPFFEYKSMQFKNDPIWKDKLAALEYGINMTSKQNIKIKYPEYFLGYDKALCDTKLAEIECGVYNKISHEELACLLGWSLKDRILCTLPYYSSKLKQKLMNKFQRKTK
jgi:hypothetical protein